MERSVKLVNETEFEQIYNTYYMNVYSYVMTLTKNQNEADTSKQVILVWEFFGFYKLHYEKFADGTVREIELPFEFPYWWNVQRFNSLISLVRGSSPRPIKNFVTDDDDGVNWIKIGDTSKDDKYVNFTAEKITKIGSEKSRPVYKGDFLLSNSMSFGRPYILNIDGFIHDGWFALRHYNTAYEPEFLYLLITSKIVNRQFTENATGSTVKNISSDIVNITFMPIPPIEEQKRIVNITNQLFEYVDLIETEQQSLQQLSVQLKQKVLDVAMQGKLVPQDPNDEPASVLLDKIREEKQRLFEEGKLKKKDLIEIPISPEDNAHYGKLPRGWEMAPVSAMAKVVMGHSPKGASITDSQIAKSVEFHQGKTYFGDESLRNSSKYTTEITRLINTDAVVMSVRAPVGDVNQLTRPIVIGRGLAAFTPYGSNLDFLYRFLQTQKATLEHLATGTTFKAISGEVVRNQLIPLPPLAEQEKITKTIEMCFAQISGILETT